MAMSSEKVNPIKEQPYAISPAMSDAPPPPYSSLYPAAAHHHAAAVAGYGPIQMSHAIPMSPFYTHQNGAIGPPPPPPHPQLLSPAAGPPPPPPPPTHQMLGPTSAMGHHHQMYAAAASMPQHFIPTAAAGQQYIYQTVVPTAYGPMIAPVQFTTTASANNPALMLAAAGESCFDPRGIGGGPPPPPARYDETLTRQTIPVAPFGIIPQSQMALMYGHNGPMLVSKPNKKPFY